MNDLLARLSSRKFLGSTAAVTELLRQGEERYALIMAAICVIAEAVTDVVAVLRTVVDPEEIAELREAVGVLVEALEGVPGVSVVKV